MAREDRDRFRIQKLEDRVPLAFRWERGRTLPSIAKQEMVIFENLSLDTALLGVRRGSKEYWFFSSPISDGATAEEIDINLLNHAPRHATGGADPIDVYDFTWKNPHIFFPSTDAVPIKILASSPSQTKDLFQIFDKDGMRMVETNTNGQVGIGQPTMNAQFNVKAPASSFSPLDINSLELWFDAGDLDATYNNGDPITAGWADKTGTYTATPDGVSSLPNYFDPTGTGGSFSAAQSARAPAEWFSLSPTKTFSDTFTVIIAYTAVNQNGGGAIIVGEDYQASNNLDWITTWPRDTPGTGQPDWCVTNKLPQNFGVALTETQGLNVYNVQSFVVKKQAADERRITVARVNGEDKLGGITTFTTMPDIGFDCDLIMAANGAWVHVLVFDEELTAAQIELVENFLAFDMDITVGSLDKNDPNLAVTSRDIFEGQTGSGDTEVIIKSDGKVGIGTTGPSQLLHIEGSNPKIRITGGTDELAQVQLDNANAFKWTFGLTSGVTSVFLIRDQENGLTHFSATAGGIDEFFVPVHITTTTAPQFQINYDGSNNTQFEVTSNGNLDITPSGPHVNFTDHILRNITEFRFNNDTGSTSFITSEVPDTGTVMDPVVLVQPLAAIGYTNTSQPMFLVNTEDGENVFGTSNKGTVVLGTYVGGVETSFLYVGSETVSYSKDFGLRFEPSFSGSGSGLTGLGQSSMSWGTTQAAGSHIRVNAASSTATSLMGVSSAITELDTEVGYSDPLSVFRSTLTFQDYDHTINNGLVYNTVTPIAAHFIIEGFNTHASSSFRVPGRITDAYNIWIRKGNYDGADFASGKGSTTIGGGLDTIYGLNIERLDYGNTANFRKMEAEIFLQTDGGIFFREIWDETAGEARSTHAVYINSDTANELDLHAPTIVNVKSGLGLRSSTITSADTADSRPVYYIDASSNSVTLDMPASPVTDQMYWVKAVDATNTVTVDGNGNNIDGASTITIAEGDCHTLHFDGTEWRTI